MAKNLKGKVEKAGMGKKIANQTAEKIKESDKKNKVIDVNK